MNSEPIPELIIGYIAQIAINIGVVPAIFFIGILPLCIYYFATAKMETGFRQSLETLFWFAFSILCTLFLCGIFLAASYVAPYWPPFLGWG